MMMSCGGTRTILPRISTLSSMKMMTCLCLEWKRRAMKRTVTRFLTPPKSGSGDGDYTMSGSGDGNYTMPGNGGGSLFQLSEDAFRTKLLSFLNIATQDYIYNINWREAQRRKAVHPMFYAVWSNYESAASFSWHYCV